MKNYLAILCSVTISSFSAKSQEKESVGLKPFKVDISVGYAMPGGEGSKAGVLFAIEPKYAVVPNVSIGLRMEGAVVARFAGYDENGRPLDVSVKAAGSYLATGDYYLKENYSFRPYIGAGAGIFSIASAEVKSTSGGVSAGSKFGGMVRAGFEASHFRLGLEYNIVTNTTFEGYDQNGDLQTGLTSPNNYLGIKIGVCIGGGRK